MSLVRLLSSGRSLIGFKDEAGRYQMTNQRLLPKFGSVKNPFRAGCPPGQMRLTTPSVSENRAVPAVSQVASVEMPQSQAAMKFAESKRHIYLSHVWRKLCGWSGRLQKGWGRLLPRQEKNAARVALPQLVKPPIQSELSLERVRVLRNDLSDVDLEVVPVKLSVQSPNAVPVLHPVGKTESSGLAWGRATMRFLRLSKA
jgi:hypothetical protein